MRGLFLLAPHFFVEASGLVEIAEAERRYRTTDLRERLARHHRDPEVAFWGWNRAWLDPGFPAVFDLQPEIAHIRVPVLIVQGEADRYGTVEHAGYAEREAYCPVETLLLPGIGHAPHVEAPDVTLAAVQDFAARLFGVHEAGQRRNNNAGTVAAAPHLCIIMHRTSGRDGSRMARIDFQTDPGRYRHWKLRFDGPVAELVMDVDPDGGLFEGYELKLNSYDLGVDIELRDAVQRLRFEHPEVGAVVIRSGKEGVFCAGANIRMLGKASHGHKVNFCKFTNETRCGIEDSTREFRPVLSLRGERRGGGRRLRARGLAPTTSC